MLVPGNSPGMIDLVLWIAAFVCFLIAAFVGERLTARVDLIALGLAAASLTFII
jgi:hypothetical protein